MKGIRSFPKAKRPWEISYESLLQNERNVLDAIRQDPKLRNLYQFLERDIQRPIKPGTLQTVPADTGEQKRIAGVARGVETKVVFWKASGMTVHDKEDKSTTSPSGPISQHTHSQNTNRFMAERQMGLSNFFEIKAHL